jgi:hypothetical protein
VPINRLRRYGVALVFASCGVVAVVIGWWTGAWGVGMVGSAFMGPYALIAYFGGGRAGRFRTLRGELDEREREHDDRAFVVAGSVILAVLLTIWVRELLDGNINSQAQWLMTVFGATYAGMHAYYWWRDRAN